MVTNEEILQRDPALAEIVRRLVEEFQPERVYMFGSKARGDEGPDSDYDLMVVVRQAAEPSYRLSQHAYSLLRGIRAAVDVLVWTRRAFDGRLHLKASLPATIVREGKLLYAA